MRFKFDDIFIARYIPLRGANVHRLEKDVETILKEHRDIVFSNRLPDKAIAIIADKLDKHNLSLSPDFVEDDIGILVEGIPPHRGVTVSLENDQRFVSEEKWNRIFSAASLLSEGNIFKMDIDRRPSAVHIEDLMTNLSSFPETEDSPVVPPPRIFAPITNRIIVADIISDGMVDCKKGLILNLDYIDIKVLKKLIKKISSGCLFISTEPERYSIIESCLLDRKQRNPSFEYRLYPDSLTPYKEIPGPVSNPAASRSSSPKFFQEQSGDKGDKREAEGSELDTVKRKKH